MLLKACTLFLQDHSWIDVFGERMILQIPEDMELYPLSPELEEAFSYLIQLIDGNWIDLILVPAETCNFSLGTVSAGSYWIKIVS